jgi:hypothetical protein
MTTTNATSSVTTRIAVGAALLGVVAWAAKSCAIAAAGGLGKSPLEGPLFLIGFVAVLIASAAYAVGLASHGAAWVRALAGVGGLVAGVAFILLLGAVVSVVQPAHPGWVWGEVNLWVSALATLAVCLRGAGVATLTQGLRA